MKTAVVRAEVQRLIRQAPFRPFVLNLENGDRITIGNKCQEPKNDFLASMCPKWVPDTLSAPLPLPSTLLAPTTGLRHDQRMSPFPSPHHSKNRPTLTWKSPSRSGMV